MAIQTRSQASASPAPKASASTSAINADGDAVVRQRPRVGSRSRNVDDVYDAKVAVDLATTTVDENVFLFVPNLIGYARVILAGVSLYYMPVRPLLCTVIYGISCLLDAVDGQAARALGQASKFGAVLDMVTDRCTTACLLCFLAIKYSQYPAAVIIFQFLIALDFASHYIHMYSSLVTGSSSHKKITQDVSRILWLYYNNKVTLFTFCFCNELFFVALYLAAFIDTPISKGFWLTWPQLLALVNFPIMFGKQIINCVQFWKASKILVGIDLIERQQARAAALRASTAQAIIE
jgi:CDP-diacylglycerol--inositol 3-phosphatidyltransferase